MSSQIVRTTAFCLQREHFGRVYVYRPGERFVRAWTQLADHWRHLNKNGDFHHLPYRGLATALRVLSGDFVALQRRINGSSAFIITRRPLSQDDLSLAIGAWEVYGLQLSNSPISRVLEDLICEEVEVWDQVHRREGLCPEISANAGWVWDVGIWEIAHQLAAENLRTDDGGVPLRLDSDAALLSWERLVEPQPRSDAGAMHKVTLKLITVPGIELPVVSLQSSLVRLAPEWRRTGGARYAWAELGSNQPLLRGRVRNLRVDGGFTTVWADRAVDVLRGASLHALPATEAGPTLNGALRTGYKIQPKSHRIGRGVGKWFHEFVALHAHSCLKSTQCIQLVPSRKSWPRKGTVAPREPLGFAATTREASLRLLVIYASSSVRRRIRDSLAQAFGDDAHSSDHEGVREFSKLLEELSDDVQLDYGPISVMFVRPPEADQWLLTRNEPGDIERWISEWFPDEFEAAIIETDETAADARNRQGADPKQVIRKVIAGKKTVSQFITSSSAPKATQINTTEAAAADHAALNATSDMMRNAGFFLRPFPVHGVGKGTLVVGIYGTRLTGRRTGRGTSYVTNLVAVRLGTRDAWGYVDGRGWLPVGEATASFLGTDQALAENMARARVERAIGQLFVALTEGPAILLFDAIGCRRFWRCLTDKADGVVEPWMAQKRSAVVRVRASMGEVPRPAGEGRWEDGPNPVGHKDFRPMSVVAAPGKTPTFVLSGSAVMSRVRKARDGTRFTTDARGLGEDWHSLGTTELLVMDPGDWDSDNVAGQVAMLCRIAPTWDRTLRWPSPLHMARAVVRDHPFGYFAEEEPEEVEDGHALRFDLGIFD